MQAFSGPRCYLRRARGEQREGAHGRRRHRHQPGSPFWRFSSFCGLHRQPGVADACTSRCRRPMRRRRQRAAVLPVARRGQEAHSWRCRRARWASRPDWWHRRRWRGAAAHRCGEKLKDGSTLVGRDSAELFLGTKIKRHRAARPERLQQEALQGGMALNFAAEPAESGRGVAARANVSVYERRRRPAPSPRARCGNPDRRGRRLMPSVPPVLV